MADDTIIRWEIEMPIFRDPIILRQLGMAIGIPFGLVVLVLLFTGGEMPSSYTLYALGLIGVLFLFTYILIMVLYGGKYAAGFILDDKGIWNYTQRKQAQRNLIINWLTAALGLLTGKPAAAGAGLLAQSRQMVLIRWNRIRKVRYYPRNYTILIRGGFAENVAVFCPEEKYTEIRKIIQQKAGRAVISTR